MPIFMFLPSEHTLLQISAYHNQHASITQTDLLTTVPTNLSYSTVTLKSTGIPCTSTQLCKIQNQ